MHEAIIQDLYRADNYHVLLEVLLPLLLFPKIATHLPTKALDLLVEIAFKDGKLLEHQSHTVYLISD